MAWPDKVGIGVACLIVAFTLWTLFLLVTRLPPEAAVTVYGLTRMGAWTIKALLIVALPIWLAARLVDFVLGGPAKRKAKQNSN
jgi:uncharacterized membrane protein